MRVTVGVPTYNRADLLKETIESVLGQTFGDFRLLVSDNASTDDTPAVVRSYADERIRYARMDENVGRAANILHLIDLAETEFVLILPDDDLLYPGHLQAAVEVLDRFPNVGLVHTAFNSLDERSRVTGSHFPLKGTSGVTVERRDLVLERLMVTDFPVCFPSVLYRTEVLRAAEGLRAEDGPFNDIHVWMRIAAKWDFGYVAEPLAGVRIHENTATSEILAQEGVSSEDEVAVLFAQMRFERRTTFLDDSTLEPGAAARLRALATLDLIAARASRGMPWAEALGAQARLLRAYPRIVERPAFWRLLAAQLGARHLRALLRGARGSRRLR